MPLLLEALVLTKRPQPRNACPAGQLGPPCRHSPQKRRTYMQTCGGSGRRTSAGPNYRGALSQSSPMSPACAAALPRPCIASFTAVMQCAAHVHSRWPMVDRSAPGCASTLMLTSHPHPVKEPLKNRPRPQPPTGLASATRAGKRPPTSQALAPLSPHSPWPQTTQFPTLQTHHTVFHYTAPLYFFFFAFESLTTSPRAMRSRSCMARYSGFSCTAA